MWNKVLTTWPTKLPLNSVVLWPFPRESWTNICSPDRAPMTDHWFCPSSPWWPVSLLSFHTEHGWRETCRCVGDLETVTSLKRAFPSLSPLLSIYTSSSWVYMQRCQHCMWPVVQMESQEGLAGTSGEGALLLWVGVLSPGSECRFPVITAG